MPTSVKILKVTRVQDPSNSKNTEDQLKQEVRDKAKNSGKKIKLERLEDILRVVK